MTGPGFPNQQQEFLAQQRRQQMMAAWSEQQRRKRQQQLRPVSPVVDPRFSQVEQESARLKQQLAAGRITPAQLDAKLRDLMIQDTAGTWWMVGGQSGRWHRFDGRDWVSGVPPQAVPGLTPGIDHAAWTGQPHPVRAFFLFLAGLLFTVVVTAMVWAAGYNVLVAVDAPGPGLLSLIMAALVAVFSLVDTWRRARRQARGF